MFYHIRISPCSHIFNYLILILRTYQAYCFTIWHSWITEFNTKLSREAREHGTRVIYTLLVDGSIIPGCNSACYGQEGILKKTAWSLIIILSWGNVSTKLQCFQVFVDALLKEHIWTDCYANLTLPSPCYFGEKQQGFPLLPCFSLIQVWIWQRDSYPEYIRMWSVSENTSKSNLLKA